VYSVPVTLAEILEVQGTALNQDEIWTLLYATAKSLADLLTQGKWHSFSMGDCT